MASLVSLTLRRLKQVFIPTCLVAASCLRLAAEEHANHSPAAASKNDELLFIDNGVLKLGVKKTWGAGVAWLSLSGSERNVINAHDHGRLVQQSYYGEKDGSDWNGQPWTWNPVQGGDWKGRAARVEKLEHGGDWLESTSIPKHWANGEDILDARFHQRIELKGPAAVIRFTMTYTGQKAHPKTHQEIPAVFVAPELDTLVYCDKGEPWTNAPLTRRKPGWPNEYGRPVEPWAAYVDASGRGVGVCVPAMESFTCYRFAADTGSPAACSYVAPLTTFAITPGTTFSYTCYLTLGTEGEIRARFQELCQQEKEKEKRGAKAEPASAP